MDREGNSIALSKRLCTRGRCSVRTKLTARELAARLRKQDGSLDWEREITRNGYSGDGRTRAHAAASFSIISRLRSMPQR